MSYAAFLAAKAQKNTGHGFDPYIVPDHLFGAAAAGAHHQQEAHR